MGATFGGGGSPPRPCLVPCFDEGEGGWLYEFPLLLLLVRRACIAGGVGNDGMSTLLRRAYDVIGNSTAMVVAQLQSHDATLDSCWLFALKKRLNMDIQTQSILFPPLFLEKVLIKRYSPPEINRSWMMDVGCWMQIPKDVASK